MVIKFFSLKLTVALFIIFCFSAMNVCGQCGDSNLPTITLSGANPQTIEACGVYTELGASAADLCDNDIVLTASIIIDATAVNTSVVGSYIVTYNVNDSDGNSAVQVTRTVNVVDTTIPTITLNGNAIVTVEACGSYTDAGAVSDDGCITIVDVTTGGATVNPNVVGQYIITYNVNDTVGNSAAEVTRTVNVVDTTIPTITLNGNAIVTVEACGSYTDAGAVSNDGCLTIVDVTTGGATVNPNVVGQYIITYNVNDTVSNPATEVTRTVNVVDTTPPTAICQNITIVLDNIGNTSIVASDIDNGSYDNCGSVTLSASQTAFTCADLGPNTVTLTVSDDNGNSSICTAMVTVQDITNPLLTPATDQNVNLDSNCNITIPDVRGSAIDNCTVVVGITQSPLIGAVVGSVHNGTTDITVTAMDAAGNKHELTVVLTAKDITNPILTPAVDQNVNLDSSCEITIPDLAVLSSATDNCADVTITQNPIAGSTQSAVHGDIIDVIVTATDAAGLTDQSTVELTVEDLNENVLLSIITSDLNTIICQGTEVVFEAVVAADGDPSALTYQWLLNGSNIASATNDTYIISSLIQGDNISLEMDYCSGSRTSNTINMTVNPLLTPDVVIVSSDLDNDICAGDAVTFSVFSLINGGSNPTYQWQLDGVDILGENGATYTPSILNDLDKIQVVVTSNETCLAVNDATSNEISTIVNNLETPSVSILEDDSDICEGTLVTFDATPVNGGLNPVYQWKLNNINVGSNSNTYVNSNLSNGDVIKVVMSPSNDICVTSSTEESNEIIMNVTANETPTVSITTANNTICAGESITFNSSNTWPGSTPTYQWQIDGADVGGATSDNFTTSVLTNGQLVTLRMISNYSCLTTTTANSNQLAITVDPLLTPSVSIVSSDSDDKICDTGSVTFTATPVNGGSNPSYQWKLNNINVGSNSSTYANSSLADGDEVKVIMTPSNDECVSAATAESNSITTEVYTSLVAIPIIDAFGTAICYSAGGTTISIPLDSNVTDYNWTIPNGFTISSGLGTNQIVINPTGSAQDGDVTVTISNPCSPTQISAPVAITVSDFVYATAGVDQIHCAGTSEITLDGDIGGAIKNWKQWSWSDDSGGTFQSPKNVKSVYQIPVSKVNGGTIVITMETIEPTGDCGNAIVDTMTITILPTTTVVAGSYTDVCQSSSPSAIVLGNASIIGGITEAAWSITSGIGILSDTSLTSSPGTVTFTPDADYFGTVELTLTSDNPGTCSAEVDTTIITINPLAVVTAGSDDVICEFEDVSLSGSISGGATTGTWTSSSGATSFDDINLPNAIYTPSAIDITNGSVTLTFTADNPIAPCATVSDNVIITINQAPTVEAGDEKFICSIDTVTMTATLGGNASSGTWSSSSGATSFNDINSPNAIYTPSATDISNGVVILTYTTDDPDGSGPCSVVSDDVIVNISLASTVDVGTDDSICSNESYAVSAIIAGGVTGGTWSTSGGGNFDNELLTATTYNPSISDIANGSVTLTFTTTDAIPPCSEISDSFDLEIKRAIEITSQPVNTGVCISSPASFSVTAEGDDLEYQWYYTSNDNKVDDDAFISGSTTNTLNFLETKASNAEDYYVIVSSGNSECSEVRSSDVTLTVNQVIEIIIDLSSQAVCSGSTATFTVEAIGSISEYIWYYNDVEVARGTDMTSYDIPNVSAADNGEYYVIIESTGNFCANISSLKVDLTVREPIVITTQPLSQDICTDGNVTLSVVATGNITGYQWRQEGIDIAGATDPTYTVSSSGNYDVVIAAVDGACNGGFETSNIVAISISPYPEGGTLSFGDPDPGRIYLTCENPAPGNTVPLTLSDEVGTVVKWEYRTSSDTSWSVVDDGSGGNYMGSVLSALQIYNLINLESLVFRVEVASGACLPNAFSETAIISVIPSNIVPSPVQVSKDVICIGEDVLLSSETGYGEEFGKFEGGDFDNASIDDSNTWRIKDGDGDIQNFETSADNTRPDIWLRATPHDFITADYDTPPYTISEERWDSSLGNEGNKGFAIVSGNNPSTLETPIFALAGLDEAILTFDQGYNLTPGATIMVEISTNGGVSYNTEPVLFQESGAATSENYDHFGEGTPGINQMEIDLGDYLGYSNLRIRFSYNGTRDGDVWALDNIKVPEGPRGITLEWWDRTDPDAPVFIGDSNTETWTPTKIGWNVFVVQTLLILDSTGNTCSNIQNSAEIRVFAFDQYNISITASTDGCGTTSVDLSATVVSDQQGEITGYGYPTDDGYIGMWDIEGPEGYVLSNTDSDSGLLPKNDPNASFTVENSALYTFKWILEPTKLDENGVIIENTNCPLVFTPINLEFGNCITLDFDGVDDHILFYNKYNLNSNFTIEVWIKPNPQYAGAPSTVQTILSKRIGDSSPNGDGYDLRLENNIVSFNWDNNESISSPYALDTDRWYHVAVSLDGSDYKLYIDGISVAMSTGSVPTSNNINCVAGAMDILSNNFNKSTNAPLHYYTGWMDELRIWNVALNQEQIHQMMNQEIEQNGTAVRGSIVPQDVSGLTWSNLDGYYQMKKDRDVVDGMLFPIAGTTTGRLRNITTWQEETAPIPYLSVRNGDWTNRVNGSTPWLWGHSVWDYPNAIGIDGITPIDWNIVVTSHDIGSTSKDITLLGLLSEAGEISIANASEAQDENNTGQMLWATHYLKLNGSIDLVGESQLLQKRYWNAQVYESELATLSSGHIERDQQGIMNSFAYNYWAAPVSKIGAGSNNNPVTISEILSDGTTSSNPKAITFGGNAAYYHADGGVSNPIKVASAWIWKFVNNSNDYAQWEFLGNNAGTVNPTEGYTMKGVDGNGTLDLNTEDQNYVFTGKPNNASYVIGDGEIIHTTFVKPADPQYPNISLAGNPFPSALDANAFIIDNAAATDATLYFWEHWSNGTHIWALYQGGYAIYNLSGGVSAVSHAHISVGGSSRSIPGQYIPVGQGFYVVSGANGGDVVFKNSQREFQRENNSSSSIFIKGTKDKSKEKTNVEEQEGEETMRIRLGFDSPDGFHRQVMVAFIEGATDSIDHLYDGRAGDFLKNDSFFIQDDKYFVIQAFGEFNEDREIPISVFIEQNQSGRIQKFMIDGLENIPDNVKIYIKDNYNDGETYDIRNTSGFEISLESGEHKDRFALVFKSRLDKLDEIATIDDGVTIYMNNSAKEIVIQKTAVLDFEQVTLFNYLGQVMKVWNTNINERNITLPVEVSTGVYIVSLQTKQGTIAKKVLIE